MKLKLDFVTNSSSVSFVAIGNYIGIDKIEPEYIKRLADKLNTTVEELKKDPYEMMGALLDGSGLEHSFGDDYDYRDVVMVGIEYSSMKDDETLKQFRERVQLLIFEATGIEEKPGHIEECWRDG